MSHAAKAIAGIAGDVANGPATTTPPVVPEPTLAQAPAIRRAEFELSEIAEPSAPAVADALSPELPDLSFGPEASAGEDATGFLNSLDVVTPLEDTQELSMFAEVEPAKPSSARFWLIVGVVAVAVAAGAYFLIRTGKLHL